VQPRHRAQWTRRFRASSDGAFQINIWIPEDSELDPRERQQALAGRDDVRRP
jgi:hypothetical protein